MNDNTTYLRQLDLVKPSELDFPILVIGAGGVGSWTTMALSKMGCDDVTVVDFDNVEHKNTPAQLYHLDDVGSPKVNALKFNIEWLCNNAITPVADRFENYFTPESNFKVIVCGVDSLDMRRVIWSKLVQNKNWEVFIDVRMAGELIRVFVVTPFSKPLIEKYVKSLDPNRPVHHEECTARSVVYNTLICGGLVASIVKKYAKKEEVKGQFSFDITNVEVY